MISNANILSALVRGISIGYAAAYYFLSFGKICGVSGILYSSFKKNEPIRSTKIGFVLGLVAAGLCWNFSYPAQVTFIVTNSYWKLAVGGLLVGFGTAMGGGCTSGHGVCGVSRLSPRSLVATACFMLSGILTVWIFK